MLILATTTDKLQLVTDAAVTVDVHASHIDCSDASPPVVDAPTKTNTAITTATTTDIVAAPGASKRRNVKTLHIRNKHATSSVNVTVVFDQNGTDYELHKATLKAGELLEYVEGVGFFTIEGPGDGDMNTASTADQTANAADTYLSGSAVAMSGRIKAGTFFRWCITATKTAAGVATPIWNLRVGTNGSTSDTSRGSATGVAQTAATDTGVFNVEAIIRAVTATGTIQAWWRFAHKNATTGFANVAQDQVFQSLSGTFDLTASGLIIGLSVNPGASGVWTIQSVTVDTVNHL